MADKSEMTFWDHLDDLRGTLLRIAAVYIVVCIAAFAAMPRIFDEVIMAPCSGSFPLYGLINSLAEKAGDIFGDFSTAPDFKVNVVSLELTSQFFTHMSATCWLALVVCFPVIIYFLWSFVSPGLYEHEKRGIRKAFVFGNLMFYLGVATGYFLVFPLAVRFLAEYRLSDHIQAVVSLDSYMDNFFTLLLMTGLVFELPLLAWLLGKMGLITRSFFGRFRRHAIVVLLIVAALVTPTGDPFTLFVVFIPLYGLWEFSAALVPASLSQSSPQNEKQ